MYKLDLPIDLKEAAAIERRRNQEEQRKARIFNSKTRMIGVDERALQQQIKDRKQQEARERERHEAFGEFARQNTAAVMLYVTLHCIIENMVAYGGLKYRKC